MVHIMPQPQAASTPHERQQEIVGYLENNAFTDAAKRLLDFSKDYCVKQLEVSAFAAAANAYRSGRRSPEYTQDYLEAWRARVAVHGLSLATDILTEVSARATPADLPSESGSRLDASQDSIAPEPPDLAKLPIVPLSELTKGVTQSVHTNQVIYECSGLGYRYGRASEFALRDISFSLRPREITGVLGANGCGKTTLLRLVAGELAAHTGSLRYPLFQPNCPPDGLRWSLIRSQIAYVPQRLDWWAGRLRTALHYAAAVAGVSPTENEERVEWTLLRLQLKSHAEKRWKELSGGFQMRAALALALVTKPRLLVLDEPLAPLDVISQTEFLNDLRHLANSVHDPLAVIMSSQHIFEVEQISDHLVLLDSGRPSYCGARANVGADRTMNHFELESSTPEKIKQALRSLRATITPDGVARVRICVPREVLGKQILEMLCKHAIEVVCFRDISCSTRAQIENW